MPGGPHTRLVTDTDLDGIPAVNMDENGRPLLFNPDAVAFARAAHKEMSGSRSRPGAPRGRTTVPRTMPQQSSTYSFQGLRPTPSASSLASSASNKTIISSSPRATRGPVASAARPVQQPSVAPRTDGRKVEVDAIRAELRDRQRARDEAKEAAKQFAEDVKAAAIAAQKQDDEAKAATAVKDARKQEEEEKEREAATLALALKQKDAEAGARQKNQKEERTAELTPKKQHKDGNLTFLRELVHKEQQAKREVEGYERRQAAVREQPHSTQEKEEAEMVNHAVIVREAVAETLRPQRQQVANDRQTLQDVLLDASGDLLRRLSNSQVTGHVDSPTQEVLSVEREVKLSGATARIRVSTNTVPTMPSYSTVNTAMCEEVKEAGDQPKGTRPPVFDKYMQLVDEKKKLEEAKRQIDEALANKTRANLKRW